MKKILFIILILQIYHSATAQNFKGKIILGINGSQVDGDRLSGYDKPGILFGAGTEYLLNENVGLQGEILFSQKGSKSTKKDLVYFILRINYLEIPLLLNYHLSIPSIGTKTGTSSGLLLQAGISFDYLISAKLDDGDGFADRQETLKNFDYCYNIGFGYDVTENINLNIRFTYSILPINITAVNNLPANRFGLFNNTLSFTFRYLLDNGA
ncbi:MAG: PorT family protein [Bacteroidetes bacterium]|nr:PorT family protein [Bacteroidota bacterium]